MWISNCDEHPGLYRYSNPSPIDWDIRTLMVLQMTSEILDSGLCETKIHLTSSYIVVSTSENNIHKHKITNLKNNLCEFEFIDICFTFFVSFGCSETELYKLRGIFIYLTRNLAIFHDILLTLSYLNNLKKPVP